VLVQTHPCTCCIFYKIGSTYKPRMAIFACVCDIICMVNFCIDLSVGHFSHLLHRFVCWGIFSIFCIEVILVIFCIDLCVGVLLASFASICVLGYF
jgi:ribose/xylose/arabinose/galactoside ABC-type transport system permease subunit